MNSYPNRNREFQKNSQKIQKIKIPHYGFFLTPKQVEKGRERKKKKKKNHLDEFLSHPEKKILKKKEKNSKNQETPL